ncbi:dynamin family protein [Intrasporangium sp.]|uniref:dynamin family protein n=1 Tax=Intrasporangium sp. TaxID=1925024 RepID=UPI00293AB845|nr:dynamin family protein [Intrasporangium sp.]MDV3220834.1 50S ribosome-binding GTPase [Intrasporangium sp.]
MSPIRKGKAKVRAVTAAELGDRTTSLSLALVSGAEDLDAAVVEQARRVLDRAHERSAIAGDHTVVALAGATGSGKSSLFNALIGEDVAEIGARRPTTAKPTAAVWGDTDASELLDWLHVDARHIVGSAEGQDEVGEVGESAEDVASGGLDSLVLLDLPDFDSRELSHRREAERILELVDMFVWVTDPQKYADARLHDEFVSLMAHHDAVTLAVLNQTDRLGVDAVKVLTKDFTKLLEADGIHRATVLATSAVSGTGIPELRQRLANAVAGHAASRQRLNADVIASARRLRQGVADREVEVGELDRRQLDESLARAAGVPIVLDAVARDYRREAFAHTGWLYARWTRGFAADPLRRLRLDRTGGRPPIRVDIEGSDVRAVLGRSSIPAPSASSVAGVDLATRDFVREASAGLPVRWAQAVEEAVDQGDGALTDALDQAIVGTSLRARRPIWWFVVNVLQWVLGIVAALGLLWMAALWVVGLAQIPAPETPSIGILPVPLVMLVGGILLGLLLGAVSRWWAQIGARRRKALIAKRLTAAVAEVADKRILGPIDEVLARHHETREHLDRAAG